MREKIYRFMQGRYGGDQLNRFLMVMVLICFAVSLFGGRVFYLIGTAILVYAYFRMFSRNIFKRRAENTAYLRIRIRYDRPSPHGKEICGSGEHIIFTNVHPADRR